MPAGAGKRRCAVPPPVFVPCIRVVAANVHDARQVVGEVLEHEVHAIPIGGDVFLAFQLLLCGRSGELEQHRRHVAGGRRQRRAEAAGAARTVGRMQTQHRHEIRVRVAEQRADFADQLVRHLRDRRRARRGELGLPARGAHMRSRARCPAPAPPTREPRDRGGRGQSFSPRRGPRSSSRGPETPPCGRRGGRRRSAAALRRAHGAGAAPVATEAYDPKLFIAVQVRESARRGAAVGRDGGQRRPACAVADRHPVPTRGPGRGVRNRVGAPRRPAPLFCGRPARVRIREYSTHCSSRPMSRKRSRAATSGPAGTMGLENLGNTCVNRTLTRRRGCGLAPHARFSPAAPRAAGAT